MRGTTRAASCPRPRRRFRCARDFRRDGANGDEPPLLLVNRRGFGASPAVEGEDFDVDAGDLAEVLAEEPAHLVGHSYGGVVSLIAAAQVPGSVQSLTVFEPPAFGLVADDPEVRRFIDAIQAILTADPPPDEFLRRFAVLVGGDPSRLPTPLPESLLGAARVQMRGRWAWDAVIPLEALAAAHWPKLVVSGGHSRSFELVCDVLERQLPARREVSAERPQHPPTGRTSE